MSSDDQSSSSGAGAASLCQPRGRQGLPSLLPQVLEVAQLSPAGVIWACAKLPQARPSATFSPSGGQSGASEESSSVSSSTTAQWSDVSQGPLWETWPTLVSLLITDWDYYNCCCTGPGPAAFAQNSVNVGEISFISSLTTTEGQEAQGCRLEISKAARTQLCEARWGRVPTQGHYHVATACPGLKERRE